MSDAVIYERKGQVASITLNRPEHNRMNPELLDAFSDASTLAKHDDQARVVVIRSRGRSFCSGADLTGDVQRPNAGAHQLAHERSYAMYEPFLSVLDIPVPVIAEIHGHAVGGGFGLALLCDIRIGATTAKYGANFAKLGLHPGMAISYLLPRLVGRSRAAELLFTGRLIHGDEATRIGILSRDVAAHDLAATVAELAAEIASSAPGAVRMTKESLNSELAGEIRLAARREALAQAATIESDEFEVGRKALLAKRKPEF